MPVTLVDSNVILDVFTQDPRWFDWSSKALAAASVAGDLAINPIIYAEASVRFESVEELEEALPRSVYQRLDLPWESAFLAGKCFLRYKRKGGERRSPLPDFYIGAHTVVSGLHLLTRDASRYRTYFPKIRITAPS
jgi:predicted nucleic acid-binding protein